MNCCKESMHSNQDINSAKKQHKLVVNDSVWKRRVYFYWAISLETIKTWVLMVLHISNLLTDRQINVREQMDWLITSRFYYLKLYLEKIIRLMNWRNILYFAIHPLLRSSPPTLKKIDKKKPNKQKPDKDIDISVFIKLFQSWFLVNFRRYVVG